MIDDDWKGESLIRRKRYHAAYEYKEPIDETDAETHKRSRMQRNTTSAKKYCACGVQIARQSQQCMKCYRATVTK